MQILWYTLGFDFLLVLSVFRCIYKRVCPSVSLSVRSLVGLSLCRSVTSYFHNLKMKDFRNECHQGGPGTVHLLNRSGPSVSPSIYSYVSS